MLNFKLARWVPAAALLAVALGACGCGGGGGAEGGGLGTLAVRMSDAPAVGITAAHVTVTKIDAHIGSAWQTLFEGEKPVDLFALRNEDALLGSALVPAGDYTQVRLFVKDATVTDDKGDHPVTIPSATKTGIKINLNYTVTPNEITEILLDFNVKKSFVIQGKGTYMLKPVIPAVVKILSGTASGVVSNAAGPVEGATVTATYTAGPNYAVGTEVNGSISQADGRFKVWALLPGTYSFGFTYVDPGTSATLTATKPNVTIAANQDTVIGPVLVE